ncbi:MAG: ROK family protein [Limnochordaceae bacterium]|nr:ROK family protein [Limnochordaceae bacterium]
MPAQDKPTSVIAVDVGGTQLRAARVTCDGRVVERAALPVSAPDDGAALTRQLLDLVRPLLVPDAGAVGVGLPAVIDRKSGRVEWAPHLPGWNGTPLAGALAEELEMPVVLEYDGHAAALGEHWVGAGRGVEDMVCLVVGTGVGGGIIAGGRLIRGHTNLAGATGWMGVPTRADVHDPELSGMGVLEGLIAGPGIERAAARRIGCPIPSKEVFDKAAAGDPDCGAIVRDALEHLSWGLINVVSMLDPALVLLGGSVGLRLGAYAADLEATVRKFAQPWSARRVRIAPAGLGGDAGLLGAARSALDYLETRR